MSKRVRNTTKPVPDGAENSDDSEESLFEMHEVELTRKERAKIALEIYKAQSDSEDDVPESSRTGKVTRKRKMSNKEGETEVMGKWEGCKRDPIKIKSETKSRQPLKKYIKSQEKSEIVLESEEVEDLSSSLCLDDDVEDNKTLDDRRVVQKMSTIGKSIVLEGYKRNPTGKRQAQCALKKNVKSEDELFQKVKRPRIKKVHGNTETKEANFKLNGDPCNSPGKAAVSKDELVMNAESVGLALGMTPEAITETARFNTGTTGSSVRVRHFLVKWKELGHPEWVKEQFAKAMFPHLVFQFYEDERDRRLN